MQLRYLIGGNDSYRGVDNEIIELSYDAVRPPAYGVGVKYGNLFLEKYSEMPASERAEYAPFLDPGDTAEEYGEGQIDPEGQGWNKNLDEQIKRALAQGFTVIEWDNPDSYNMDEVIGAVDRAQAAGLEVLAKNPLICSGNKTAYMAHPAVIGVVVEQDCGSPGEMDMLRHAVSRPELPVWFVAFGPGGDWADRMADQIRNGGFANMGVTYSEHGEYWDSTDILVPIPPAGEAHPPPLAVATVDITIVKTDNVRVVINGTEIP